MLEAGQKSLLLSEALVLADVLHRPLNSLLDEADLVDEISITSSLSGSWSDLQALIEGGFEVPSLQIQIKKGRRISARAKTPDLDMMGRLRELGGGIDDGELIAVAGDTRSEAELRAARQLGITPTEISVAAYALWGASLTEERESRLDETGQAEAPLRNLRGYRGHVTRELVHELGLYLLRVESGLTTTQE
jgi:hypothetical protein